jgi:hypothetical protein
MIQRIQSIWLFLVAVFDALTFRLPFYSGDWNDDAVQAVVDLNAQSTIWFTVLSVIAGAIGLATIFLFRNRKLQLKLIYLGLFVSIVLLTLYFLEKRDFSTGNLALWAIFYFAILVSYLLAARGVRSDEKLVRSMDRLR